VDNTLPPLAEVFPKRQLIERHPHLLSEHRLAWALRNRRTNGLEAAGAVYETGVGEIVLHEPRFLQWFLGLSGRGKPRRLRRSRPARPSPAGTPAPNAP
jgi:hypothetical protein